MLCLILLFKKNLLCNKVTGQCLLRFLFYSKGQVYFVCWWPVWLYCVVSHSVCSVIVVPHKWIKCSKLSPANTQLLISVTFKSTHVCPDQRNSIQTKQQHSYTTHTYTTHSFKNTLTACLRSTIVSFHFIYESKKPQNMNWEILQLRLDIL